MKIYFLVRQFARAYQTLANYGICRRNDIIRNMRKALIVEDDPDSAEGFKIILTRMGFECVVDPIGDMAIKYLSSGEFDIAIMDIVLKTRMTGSDIIHAARELGVKTPIIGVSDKRGPADRANDLRAGATDHMEKPCHPAELRERVLKAVNGQDTDTYLVSDDIILDVKTRTARRGDRVLKLRRLSFDLLTVLMRAKGDFIPSARLRDTLGLMPKCEETAPLDKNGSLRMAILRLREELTSNGERDPIHHEKPKGYALF